MKIQNKNIPGKKVFTIIVILLLLGASGGAALLYMKNSSNNTMPEALNTESSLDSGSKIDQEPPTDEQEDAADQIKRSSVDDSGDESDSNTPTLSVSASSNDSVVRVQATISTVTNQGQCIAKMSKDDQEIIVASEVQALTSYSACKNLEFNRSNISSNGTWNISVEYINNEKRASSETSIDL